jgi:flagellar protein FliO/FliZ
MNHALINPWSTAPWLFAGVSLSAVAEEPPAGAVGAGEAVQVIGGLLLVLVLIAALAWVFRRAGGLRAGGSPALSVLGTLSLGTRERVVLVRANGVQLLLGVAPGRISTLHVLGESEEEDRPEAVETVVPAGFRQLLSRATKSESVR